MAPAVDLSGPGPSLRRRRLGSGRAGPVRWSRRAAPEL